MKQKAWTIGLSLSIAISYIVASPFITVNQIKSGIEAQDAEQLSENIDFPLLRQNMKDQFNARMMKEVAAGLDDNPFGALAVGFASKFVDGMVDSFITPASLASLMEGKKPSDASSNTLPSSTEERQPFKNARYSFDSTAKFSVLVPNDNGEEIRFILTRSGLDWKLSNIIIPLEKPASDA